MLVTCIGCSARIARAFITATPRCYNCRRDKMNAYRRERQTRLKKIREEVNGKAEKVFFQEATERAKKVQPTQVIPKHTYTIPNSTPRYAHLWEVKSRSYGF